MLSGFIWDLSLIIQKITRSFKRTVDFFLIVLQSCVLFVLYLTWIKTRYF